MILVTGATGFVGRHLVQRLMDEGRQVRVLLPEQKQKNLPWENPPEIITGTLLNDEAVFHAASGSHIIYHLENAQWWGRPRNLERIELVGTRNLLTIARSARVGRVITMSHIGASPSSAYPVIRIKGQVEELVRASGLAYTVIRSGLVFGEEDAFINNIAMMLAMNPFFFILPGQGEVVLHPIYIDDLISVLVSALERIDTVDQIVDVGGSEYTTFHDLVRTVMRVTGMHRTILSVPPYMMRWSSGFYNRVLRRTLLTPMWLDLLATNRTARLGNAYDYFGVRTRRFEDTLLTYMPGRRYLFMALRYSFRRRPRELL